MLKRKYDYKFEKLTPMHKEKRNRSADFARMVHEMDIQSPKACHFDIRSKLRDFIQFLFCLPSVKLFPGFCVSLPKPNTQPRGRILAFNVNTIPAGSDCAEPNNRSCRASLHFPSFCFGSSGHQCLHLLFLLLLDHTRAVPYVSSVARCVGSKSTFPISSCSCFTVFPSTRPPSLDHKLCRTS